MFRKSYKQITDLTEMHKFVAKLLMLQKTKKVTKECTKLMFIPPLSYSQILHQMLHEQNQPRPHITNVIK